MVVAPVAISSYKETDVTLYLYFDPYDLAIMKTILTGLARPDATTILA